MEAQGCDELEDEEAEEDWKSFEEEEEEKEGIEPLGVASPDEAPPLALPDPLRFGFER